LRKRKNRGIYVFLLLFIIPVMKGLLAQEQFVAEYRIGPKDILEISVIGFEDLNRRVRVSEEGKISLPYLGDIAVDGMTKSDLEKKLGELLEEKYLQNPQITVTIVDYQSRRVFLLGAVTRPGPYELLGRLTLLKLISQAGGLSTDAGNEIIVMRQMSDGTTTSLKISVEELVLKGDARLDIPLQADDIITIPMDKPVPIYVTGQVRNPGVLSAVKKSNIPTLLRAIAQAGGFAERASKGGVIIKRIDAAGKETEIRVNVEDIIKGKKKDIQLQENDVIIVPEKWI